MDLKKLLAETLKASRSGAALPDYAITDQPPEEIEAVLDDLASETNPDEMQEISQPEVNTLPVGQPDTQHESGLSIPELFEQQDQELGLAQPDPGSYTLPEEPQVAGEPDVRADELLEAEAPEAPENLSLPLESRADIQDEDLTTETPEDLESPSYGVERPAAYEDRDLEVETPEIIRPESVGVAGFVRETLPQDEADEAPAQSTASLDYAELLRDALDEPLDQMRQAFSDHTQDYVAEQVLLTQIFGGVA